MATDPERNTSSLNSNDATARALEREKAAPSNPPPVKQHNPQDKGLNPGHTGPAQPRESGG